MQVVSGLHLQLGGPGASAAEPLPRCQIFTQKAANDMLKVAQFRVVQCSKAAASYSEGSAIGSGFLLAACCLERVSVCGGQLIIDTNQPN